MPLFLDGEVSGGAVTLFAEVIAVALETGPAAGRRRIGWSRAVVHLPAVLASAALLLVAAGPYSAQTLAVWLIGGLFAVSRIWERLTLRWWGFRPLDSLQRMQLRPVAAAALVQAGIGREDVDWYVLRSGEPNAFAAGRRAVAVTTGLLDEFGSHRLSEPMVRGILIHELGHHATSTDRCGLAMQWLAAPWRVSSRFVGGVCVTIAGHRQPPRLLALVVVASVVIAVVQARGRDDWVTVAALCALAACAVGLPMLDAALARRAEWAADRFAAAVGAGYELTCALTTLDGRGGHRRPRLLDRVLAKHPDPAERIAALLSPSAGHAGHAPRLAGS